MSGLVISTVECAPATATRDIGVDAVLTAIRTGGKNLRGQIEQIRNKFEAELAIAQANAEAGQNVNPLQVAKLAVSELKKQLPAVIWSGTFSYRASDKLLQHSGLLCADLDELGPELPRVREQLQTSPHLFALFLSPTGNGLKAVFRAPADVGKHAGSFRAVVQHVRDLTGVQIDESCKDVARLCFLSFDPELYHNPNATELEPLPEPEKPKPVQAGGELPPDLSLRERITTQELGPLKYSAEKGGYFCECPGEANHTNITGDKHTIVYLSGVPTLDCRHGSCKKIVEAFNAKLRSEIGKAERAASVKENSGPSKKSAATELVQLADEFAFFHDPQDRPFVRLEISGHREVWPVESIKFRKLLARIFYKRTGRAINRNALADAITALAGRACHDGPEQPVFLRVAPDGENILIDLCDDQWRVVEVTLDGWQILDKSPVAFIRTGSMQSLPEPVKGGGSIAPLWKLLNVTEAQRPLVAGALLSYFHPRGPYFVTNFVGEQGTAKSCAARIVRQLVDPNENPLRSPPKEERDLLAQAASNRCVALDNLSSLPTWLSDALCRLATGGGHSARTLYTDLDEISLAVKRPVILNGIEDVATRPDLAERCLQDELETIPEEKRISEKELWERFDRHRPVIFSGILDALACALREQPNIKLDSLPRMADAALFATAGETAFGWKRGTFMVAYRKNLREGAVASVEAHPVGVAIRQLLEKQNEWSGEPAQLLQTLNDLVSDEQRHAKNWPENARSLGHCLRRLALALRRAGIAYERDRSKRRVIQLSKAPEKTSQTSPNPSKNDDVDDVDDLFPNLHVDIETPEHHESDAVGGPSDGAAIDRSTAAENADADTSGSQEITVSGEPQSEVVSGDLRL